jgi:hypothetical protein
LVLERADVFGGFLKLPKTSIKNLSPLCGAAQRAGKGFYAGEGDFQDRRLCRGGGTPKDEN